MLHKNVIENKGGFRTLSDAELEAVSGGGIVVTGVRGSGEADASLGAAPGGGGGGFPNPFLALNRFFNGTTPPLVSAETIQDRIDQINEQEEDNNIIVEGTAPQPIFLPIPDDFILQPPAPNFPNFDINLPVPDENRFPDEIPEPEVPETPIEEAVNAIDAETINGNTFVGMDFGDVFVGGNQNGLGATIQIP